MIEKMHARTSGPVFKIIFALVSLSFVITGIGTGLVGNDTSAAKVNGTVIEQQTFNAAKARQQNVLNSQLGERFWDLLDDPEYATQFNQSVLNTLVDEEVLRQYAKSLNLGVSVEQIKSEIVNTPAFQQDGKFSNSLYQQVLRNNGISADSYASIVREGVLFSQIQEGIVNSNFIVPAEQAHLAKLLLQQREIRLATYSLDDEMAKQTITSEALQKYYDEHKARFVEPEKLAVEYVVLSPADLEKRVQITDEQIQTYYEKNKADYVTKGETRLAHIQVTSETEAQAIAQAVKNGEDFATLAKSKSLDKLSANVGGDLGWAKAGTFPKAFETAAENLNVGEVSQAVNVDGTYHIIKVLDRKAEKQIPLEQVKTQIAKTIRDELLASEYSSVARDMANMAIENSGSLEEVAKIGGLTVQKTAIFTQQNVPEILNNERVIKALFSGDLKQSGQNSEAIEVGDEHQPKTMFVRVSNYQAEREKTLDEAKVEVETAVKRQQAEQILLAKAEESVKALENGTANVNFDATQTLVYLQAESQQPVLARAVFTMAKPNGKSTYRVAHNDNGNVVIIALDKVADGTLEAFKPFTSQFVQFEQSNLRNNVNADLRNRASIDVNQDFMDQGINTH